MAATDYNLFCRTLRQMIDQMGIDRIMWGTDNPSFTVLMPVKDWIQIIRDLPTNVPETLLFVQLSPQNAADIPDTHISALSQYISIRSVTLDL